MWFVKCVWFVVHFKFFVVFISMISVFRLLNLRIKWFRFCKNWIFCSKWDLLEWRSSFARANITQIVCSSPFSTPIRAPTPIPIEVEVGGGFDLRSQSESEVGGGHSDSVEVRAQPYLLAVSADHHDQVYKHVSSSGKVIWTLFLLAHSSQKDYSD